MENILTGCMALLAVLDVVAGLVAFIWLAVLGEWGAIGYGFAAIPATALLITLARLGQWIRLPAMAMMDKRQSALAYLCHLLSRLYEATVAILWFGGTLLFFTQHTNNFNFWGLVVWAYSLALAGWIYRSRHVRRGDTGDTAGDLELLCIQLAYLIVAVLVVGFKLKLPLRLIEIFAAITLIGAFTASVSGFIAQQKRAALGTAYAVEARVRGGRGTRV